MSIFRDNWGLRTWVEITICFLALLVLCVGVYFLEQKSCNEFEVKTGVETKYDFWNSCLAELDNGKWVSLDNYQGIIIE